MRPERSLGSSWSFCEFEDRLDKDLQGILLLYNHLKFTGVIVRSTRLSGFHVQSLSITSIHQLASLPNGDKNKGMHNPG
jgi:hypothetical protein